MILSSLKSLEVLLLQQIFSKHSKDNRYDDRYFSTSASGFQVGIVGTHLPPLITHIATF